MIRFTFEGQPYGIQFQYADVIVPHATFDQLTDLQTLPRLFRDGTVATIVKVETPVDGDDQPALSTVTQGLAVRRPTEANVKELGRKYALKDALKQMTRGQRTESDKAFRLAVWDAYFNRKGHLQPPV